MNKYGISRRSFIPKIFKSIGIAIFISLTFLGMFIKDSGEGVEETDLPMGVQVAFISILIGLFIILLIIEWIRITKYKFYEEDQMFVIDKGIFFKKRVSIPYHSINTIAVKRSLLEMILKTSKIEIDTGTTAQPLAEARLVLNKEYALVLKDFLENRKINKELFLPSPYVDNDIIIKDELATYKVGTKRLLSLGILRPGYLLTLLLVNSFCLSVFQIASIFDEEIVFTKTESNLILLLIFLLVSFVITIGFTFVTFIINYGYKMTVKDEMIEYEYGLVSKTNFKVNIKNINSLTIKRSLLFRLFKKYSLEASIIGIGELNNSDQNNTNKNESKYILPIATKDELNEVLKLLNSEELLATDFIKPTRFRRTKFIYIPSFFMTLLLISQLVIFRESLITLYMLTISLVLCYIIIIISFVLRLKYTGYNIDKNIVVSSGSFTTSKTLIKRKNIQVVTMAKGPINQILKLANINLSYKKLLGVVHINGFTNDDFINIKDRL